MRSETLVLIPKSLIQQCECEVTSKMEKKLVQVPKKYKYDSL